MRPLVLHTSDVEQFGCPNCGCTRSHVQTDWGKEAQYLVCVLCLTSYIKLSDDLERSRITVHTAEGSNEPDVKDHPRQGIAGHDPGMQPEHGEFCYALGVEQFEAITKCLVCGKGKCIGKTFVGQVINPAKQQSICTMCPEARATQSQDHRMAIDVCMEHAEHIHLLFRKVRASGVLTEELLAEVKK